MFGSSFGTLSRCVSEQQHRKSRSSAGDEQSLEPGIQGPVAGGGAEEVESGLEGGGEVSKRLNGKQPD